jgi:hypothetical protein
VGVFRLDSDAEADADAMRKVRAGSYCEEIRFDSKVA